MLVGNEKCKVFQTDLSLVFTDGIFTFQVKVWRLLSLFYKARCYSVGIRRWNAINKASLGDLACERQP